MYVCMCVLWPTVTNHDWRAHKHPPKEECPLNWACASSSNILTYAKRPFELLQYFIHSCMHFNVCPDCWTKQSLYLIIYILKVMVWKKLPHINVYHLLPCGCVSVRVATWYSSHGVEGRRRGGPTICVHQFSQIQGNNDIPIRVATMWPSLVPLHVYITQFVGAEAGTTLIGGF